MKYIITTVALTLVIALSLMITGCSPNYDHIIADSTEAIEKNRQVWLDAILYKYRAGLWLKKGKDRRYKEDLAKAQELSDYVDERKP